MEATKFTLLGKDALISQLQSIGVKVEDGVGYALKEVGAEMQKELRAALQDGNGLPSAPGEMPHNQSGNLRSKIFSKLDAKILGQEILLSVGVSMKAFYGFILENGAAKYAKGFKRKHEAGEGLKNQSKFGARMLPRPWFWPTIERFWEKAPATVEKSINAVLKEYAP